MKTGEILHGFKFVRSRYLADIGATLHEAVYEKNGAELLFIDREESNKTFMIAFKTIPDDSTGVFHIIEHSVLCGSAKYPVKEPFVALLKGSLKTFLNAFTFPDKTGYPVSSRNEKDFLNLVDVYMDAVLNPIATKNPQIFYQEGWHYELRGKDEPLTRKGVVYNEMKGAYSSADDLEMEYITSLLYPDVCYGKDSGGDPEVIPELTYEQFCASHAKYYHPSNAKIILDGSVDLDKTLSLISSYLKDYDKLDIDSDIPMQKPLGNTFAQRSFEIGEDEDECGKCRIVLGYDAYRFDEQEKNIAIKVITDAIAGSNESPFKRAILASGLCEDVYVGAYDGVQQNALLIELKNVKEENLDKAKALAEKTISDIVEQGIDRDSLTASLNIFEFKAREQDSSYFPLGISYALAALDTWLYGGDLMDGLRFEEYFANLRAALATDYYENLLRDIVLRSRHSATLYMTPDKELGKRREAEDEQALAEYKSALSADELSKLVQMNEELEAWQKAQDTPEALATLPRLSLSDVPASVEDLKTKVYKNDENTVVFTPADTRGITYFSYIFDISDFDEDKLFKTALITDILKNVATKNYSAEGLQNAIKSDLGQLSFGTTSATKEGKLGIHLLASASALSSKRDRAVELMHEVLLSSLFEDKDAVGKIIKQIRISAKESFSAIGHQVAITRAGARINAEAAVSEYTEGLEFYHRLCALDDAYQDNYDSILASLSNVLKEIVVKERMTFAYSGEECAELVSRAMDAIDEHGKAAGDCIIKPLGKAREGIAVPAQVTFSAMAADAYKYTDFMSGYFATARTILSYGYLWNEIRVMGGAYGTGFLSRTSGVFAFYSYRDPDSARSLGKYKEAAAYLRALADSGEDLTEFIIGAAGESDPLLKPKLISALGIACYLNGTTYADRCRRRRETIGTNADALREIASYIDGMYEDGAVCIVGPKNKLEACELDSIIEII